MRQARVAVQRIICMQINTSRNMKFASNIKETHSRWPLQHISPRRDIVRTLLTIAVCNCAALRAENDAKERERAHAAGRRRYATARRRKSSRPVTDAQVPPRGNLINLIKNTRAICSHLARARARPSSRRVISRDSRQPIKTGRA